MKEVLIVGSFVQDLTWQTERFPEPGATVVGRFSTGPGGKGSNQAVAAARAGAPVRYVGAIGSDSFGRDAVQFYESEGIEAVWLERNEPTGTAGILVNAEGQNEIVVALGANSSYSAEDLPDSVWDGVKYLVCQMEIDPLTVLDLFRTAKSRNVTTILNPAPMRADFPLIILEFTDFLLPNETEFITLQRRLGESWSQSNRVFLDGPNFEKINDACRKLGPPNIILTLGDQGSFLSTKTDWRHFNARKNIKVVDTTGAGDAFVGGFVTALQKNSEDLAAACEFATAVAALSVTRFGTAPAMPARDEIIDFITQG